jgi:AcrR family transcriptional regulator
MTETRQKLLDATVVTLRDKGIAGASARSIAAAAGVNQALVFYHFGAVDELVVAACAFAAEGRVSAYRDALSSVTSLRELLAFGRRMSDAERASGNVDVLAQVLAGGQQHPGFAAAAREALDRWIAELEPTLQRLLATSPVAEVFDVPGLARGLASAFIGMELYEGVDPEGARRALDAIDALSVLVEVMDDLGPVARRALRARIRRTTKAAASASAPAAPSYE